VCVVITEGECSEAGLLATSYSETIAVTYCSTAPVTSALHQRCCSITGCQGNIESLYLANCLLPTQHGHRSACSLGEVMSFIWVIFVIVPPAQVFQVVGAKGNLQAIFLLLGMMLMSYYYDREGLLRIVALFIFGKDKPFYHVLWKVCAMTACMAAIITNDATSLVMTSLCCSLAAKLALSAHNMACFHPQHTSLSLSQLHRCACPGQMGSTHGFVAELVP